jgi:hypothetical protein
MAENFPNTCKNVLQNRQKGHFIEEKNPKTKYRSKKFVQHAIAIEFELLAFRRNMTEFLD